jgi:DNA-binding IclR family transcriptional regulator
MSLDIDVLRALLRLARRRTGPTLDQIVERVGADETAVRRALVGLARSGLVQRTPAGLRLSLAGLAVAVAFAKRRPRPISRPATPATVPLRSNRGRPRRAA